MTRMGVVIFLCRVTVRFSDAGVDTTDHCHALFTIVVASPEKGDGVNAPCRASVRNLTPADGIFPQSPVVSFRMHTEIKDCDVNSARRREECHLRGIQLAETFHQRRCVPQRDPSCPHEAAAPLQPLSTKLSMGALQVGVIYHFGDTLY
jgi:hypothetical protein